MLQLPQLSPAQVGQPWTVTRPFSFLYLGETEHMIPIYIQILVRIYSFLTSQAYQDSFQI
jgi:hypothetical protein